MKCIKIMLVCIGVLVALPAVSQYYANTSNVALDGYDVVSYHTEDKAVEGSPLFSVTWEGAVWYFVSSENAQLFAENPLQYVPEYGGYCAFAAANNSLAPIDPEAFRVIDGKLYLNFSKSVQRRWNRNYEEYIVRGDNNWPSLLKKLQKEKE